MTNPDVSKLLDYTRKEIKNLSMQVLSNEDGFNLVTLKSILEHLRSILDYSAQDILKELKRDPKNLNLKQKIYFPYGESEDIFKKKIRENLPSLLNDLPEVYTLLESKQPYKQNNNWLVDMCFLANETKHNHLSKTINEKNVRVKHGNTIDISGSENIFRNNLIDGVVMDDVYTHTNGEYTVVRRSGETIITVDNKLKFLGKEIEVIPFLEYCYTEVKDYIIKLNKLIHSNL